MTAPPAAGKWVIDKSTSSFDDSSTVVLALKAENDIQGTVGDVRPKLIVRCQEHIKEVYVYTGNQPDVESGNYDGATVRMRFDSDPAITHNAGKSTDGEALFLEPSDKFIDMMLKHQKLVFGFTPYSSSPTEINFDLQGLSEAIGLLNDACN